MLETFSDFMVFEVKDTGERLRLNLTEETFRQNNGHKILHPLQVVIIIKEELRRIYIWKGFSSSVRKKFIASRVASELQRELTNSSNFHRCKIISVDQGEEPTEFLNAFGFKKTPIAIDVEIAKNPDMLKFENVSKKGNNHINSNHIQNDHTHSNDRDIRKTPSYELLKKNQQARKILEDVLNSDIPNNFIRKNILIGNNSLYGIITKKAHVFNETIEEKEWELISGFSRKSIDLEGHKLRLHFNMHSNQIQAIEILEEISISKNSKEQTKEVNLNFLLT